MSASTTGNDRGMRAVRRVRDVRERDSRLGLLRALESVRTREERIAAQEAALAAAAEPGAATTGEFLAARRQLAAMASDLEEERRQLNASRVVATEAFARWQADRTAVKAADHLLTVRAQRRADDAARAEAREIDDIIGRMPRRRAAS